MIKHIHPEGEPTPTLMDLYERRDGSVEVVEWTSAKKDPKPSKFRVTDKGHRVLGEILRRNAIGSYIRGTEREEGIASVRHAAENRPEEKKTSSRKADWTPS